MLTFYSRISNIKTTSTQPISSLDIHFGEGISYSTKDSLQSLTGSMFSNSWKMDEEFYYQTRHLEFLGFSHFKIVAKNSQHEVMGTVKLDLFSCATGTMLNDLFLLDSKNQVLGKISFSLEMAQEEDVFMDIPSIHVSSNESIATYLKYGLAKSQFASTRVSNSSVTHEFTNNPSFAVHASLKGLLESQIKCQLWIVDGKDQMLMDEWILAKKFLPYQETPFQHNIKTHNGLNVLINGVVRFSNVPVFGQLVGGVRTFTNGIVGASLLCPGVMVPEMNPNLPKLKPKFSDHHFGQDTSKFCVFDARNADSGIKIDNTSLESLVRGHSHVFSVQTTIPLLSLPKKYFEINIKELAVNGKVTIGITPQGFPIHLSTGKDQYSYGFRSDGKKIHASTSSLYGATFKQGDIVGCGIDVTTGSLYFTKNGQFLGIAHSPVMNAESLFCTVTLTSKCKIVANFESFIFKAEQSKLNGWSLEYDEKNHLYFVNLMTQQVSYIDPRFKKNVSSYNVETLGKVLTTYKTGKEKKCNPIRSKRVLKSLSMISRNSFLPEGVLDNEKGDPIDANIGNFGFYLPSVRLLARFLDELQIQEGMNVLSIGSGIGYTTAAITKLVGSGRSVGFHHSKDVLEFSKNKISTFSRESGINLENISLKQRFPFSPMNEKIESVEYHEDFDKILCLHSIESEHLKYFEMLLSEQGGDVIACMDNVVSVFTFDGNAWSEKRIAKMHFPEIYAQLSDIEMEFEYTTKLKKYLKSLGYSRSLEQAIHDFEDDDMEELVNFCLMYHQVLLMNNVTYEIAHDVYKSFKNNQKSFVFLSNYEAICNQYQVTYQKAKDLFVKMKFDVTKVHQYMMNTNH